MANVNMTAEDQARLKAAGDAWGAAHAAGDEVGMKAAHADAELVRAKYDYSGGEDGSQYIPLRAGTAGKSSVKSGYDLSDQIKQQAAASLTAELAGLKGAYEKSMLGYDDAAKRLPGQYRQAKNQAAAQNAQEKRAFDERAAAAGMSSGTNAQAQLAMSSAYQGELAALDREQAEGLSNIELQKAQLKADYQSAILKAQAEGNAQLASDLYKEMIRTQGIQREDELLADKYRREDALLQEKYRREDELTKQKNEAAERDYARQLALSYELIDPKDIGKINSLADLAALSAAAGTAVPGTPGRSGYNNGNLTPEQVRELQAHYGLTADGMWGPNSQSTTGMTADEAWAAYQRAIAPPADAALNSLYQRIVGYITSGSKTPGEIATMLEKSALSDAQKDELLTMMGY